MCNASDARVCVGYQESARVPDEQHHQSNTPLLHLPTRARNLLATSHTRSLLLTLRYLASIVGDLMLQASCEAHSQPPNTPSIAHTRVNPTPPLRLVASVSEPNHPTCHLSSSWP